MSINESYQINLQILADAKQAIDSLKGLQAQLDYLSTAARGSAAKMQEIAAAQASAGSSIQPLLTQYQALAKTVDGQRITADAMTQAYRKQMGVVSELYGPNSQKAIKDHLSSLQGLKSSLRALNDESGATLVKQGNMVTTLDSQSASMTKFRMQADMTVKTMENLNTQWTNYAKNTQWTGRQMMVGLTAPIAAGAAGAVAVALSQDKASLQAKQLSGYYNAGPDQAQNRQNFLNIDNAARQQSTTYGSSYANNIQSLGELQGMASSAGWSNADVLGISKAAQQFNMAGQLNDLGSSTDFVRKLAQAFGGTNQSQYAQQAVAYLNQVQQVGSINMSQVPEAMTTMIPAMEALGMNLQQGIGLLSQAKAQGVDVNTFSHQLATSLGRIASANATGFMPTKGGQSKPIESAIQAYQKATGDQINMFDKNGNVLPASEWIGQLAKAMADTKNTGARDALASRIFSNRGYANLLPVFQQIGQDMMAGGANNDYNKLVGLGFGTDQQQANLQSSIKGMQNDPYYQLQNAKNQFLNSLRTLGDDLLPAVTKVVNFFDKITKAFNNMAPGTRKMIENIALVVAAVGPLTYVWGQLNVLMSTLTRFGVTKPLAAVFGLGRRTNASEMPGDISSQLADLTAKHKANAISTEEFTSKRADLLNKYANKEGNPVDLEQLAVAKEQVTLLERIIEELSKGSLIDNNGKFISNEEKQAKLAEAKAGALSGDATAAKGAEKAIAETVAGEKVGTALVDEATKGVEKEGAKAGEALAHTAAKGAGEAAKGAETVASKTGLLGKVGGLLGKAKGLAMPEILAPGGEGAAAIGTTGLVSLGPVLLPILAAVAAAIALVATHWKTFYHDVSPAIKSLKKDFDSFVKAIVGPFKEVVGQFSAVHNGASLANTVVDAMGRTVGLLIDAFRKLMDFVKPVASFFASQLANALGFVINIISAIVDLCQGHFSKAWDDVKLAAGDAVKYIIDSLTLLPRILLNEASLFAGIGSKLFSWIPGVGSALKTVKNDLASWGKDVANFGNQAKAAIDSTVHSMNKSTTATQKHSDATKKDTQNVQDQTDALNNLAPAADTTGQDLVNALQSNLKNIVGDWVTAADQGFQLYKKQRLQAFQDTITAFDNQTTAQDKMYDDQKKQLTQIQKQQDDYNKSMADAANIQLDLAEGKYSDANTLFLQQQADKTKAANQAASDQIDAAKQAYDDQRATQKQALTDQKQALSDQLDAQEQNLKEQLDTMTKYLPKTQQEAAQMQQNILNTITAATPGYGEAVTQNILGSSGWQENFDTAMENARKDVADKAYWSGVTAATYFGDGFTSDPNNNTSPPGDANTPSTYTANSGTNESAAQASMANYGVAPSAGAAPGNTDTLKTQKYFHTGGQIPGLSPDDVPIVAQAGEFMIQRKAAQALGLDALNILNNAHMMPTFHTGGTIPVGNYMNTLLKNIIKGWEGGGPPKTIDGMTTADAKSKAAIKFGLGSVVSQNVGAIPTGEHLALINQALTLAGVPVTSFNEAFVNAIVENESTWNPNAINLWDSNAMAGHPSKGLMQTIDSTFAAYRLPSLSDNIYDPLSNLVAGIRYALANYGSLGNVPGVQALAAGKGYVGYHTGGLIGKLASFDTGGSVVGNGIAMLHDGETVLKKPLAQKLENNIMNGGSYEIHVNLNGAYFGTDAELHKLGQYMEDNVMPKIRRAGGNEQRDFSSYK